MKIYWYFEPGLVGCGREGIVEVPDDATEEEIDKVVLEDIFDKVDWSWRREGER